MPIRFRLLLLATFWIGVPALRGQDALSLEDCLRMALAESVPYQVAERQKAAAAILNHPSLAGRYPSLALNVNSQGSLANQQNPASFLNGLIRSGNAAVSLDASWVVFDGFRARYNEKVFHQLEEQARVRLLDAGQQTARQVILAYLLAELQQEQVDIAREALALSGDIYRYQLERQEWGQSIRQQVLQARDALLADSISLVLGQSQHRMALIQLKLAMGRPEHEDFRVGGSLDDASRETATSDPVQKALAANPQLLEARVNQEISKLQTHLRLSSWYPRIVLQTGAVWTGNVVSVDGNNPFTGEPFGVRTGTNRNLYAGIQLSLPLLDGGIRRRQVEEGRILEMISALNVTGVTREVRSRVAILVETAGTQATTVSLSREQMRNARENLEISGERFQMGLMSLFDYRAVQLAYSLAAQRHLTALYNLRVTEVEILTLTGEIIR